MSPTSLDNGERSPRKLFRAVVARLLGRKALQLSVGRSRGATSPTCGSSAKSDSGERRACPGPREVSASRHDA
jgi:hypothetical protein